MTKFYYKDMEFDVPESVYEPQEDSELMAKALETMDLGGKSALEIGCGSGLLAILMAKNGAKVTAVDINPEAVKATEENAARNEAELHAIQSDLFSNVRGNFDLIIFNAPYLPVEKGESDYRYSGGETGRDTIEKFIAGAKSRLKPDGTILLLISSLTGEKEVTELFAKQSMHAKTIMREKVPWEELIVIQARRVTL